MVIGTVGAIVEIDVAITADEMDDTEVVSAGNVAVHPPQEEGSVMGSKVPGEGVVSTKVRGVVSSGRERCTAGWKMGALASSPTTWLGSPWVIFLRTLCTSPFQPPHFDS